MWVTFLCQNGSQIDQKCVPKTVFKTIAFQNHFGVNFCSILDPSDHQKWCSRLYGAHIFTFSHFALWRPPGHHKSTTFWSKRRSKIDQKCDAKVIMILVQLLSQFGSLFGPQMHPKMEPKSIKNRLWATLGPFWHRLTIFFGYLGARCRHLVSIFRNFPKW